MPPIQLPPVPGLGDILKTTGEIPRRLLEGGAGLASAVQGAHELANGAVPDLTQGALSSARVGVERVETAAEILAASAIPNSWKRKISEFGREAALADTYKAPDRPYPDRAVSRYVEELAMPVLERIPTQRNIDWKVEVVDSPIANATSLPDGTMLISRGLLKELDSGAGLGFIAGHEGAHAALEHGMRTLISQFGLAAVLSMAPPVLFQLLSQSGSRRHELEADAQGAATAHAAGHSVQGALDFFNHQTHSSESESRWEKLLSSHPPHSERAVRIQALSEAKNLTGGELETDRHREIQDRLPEGSFKDAIILSKMI